MAFNELMAIEGVSGLSSKDKKHSLTLYMLQIVETLRLSFKNSGELNKLINKLLPGCPSFKHHEVMVGSEVCEVYFRDVVTCIKSLFGDPDFTPYLAFQPEKHYTDESKRVHMYHDMHTGWWWLTTQVRVFTSSFNPVSGLIWTQETLDRDCPGAMIIPIIISIDKTQLTLFKNKMAYPLYLTIGNIPKEICCKPSF